MCACVCVCVLVSRRLYTQGGAGAEVGLADGLGHAVAAADEDGVACTREAHAVANGHIYWIGRPARLHMIMRAQCLPPAHLARKRQHARLT
jgi:hypothetical protein